MRYRCRFSDNRQREDHHLGRVLREYLRTSWSHLLPLFGDRHSSKNNCFYEGTRSETTLQSLLRKIKRSMDWQRFALSASLYVREDNPSLGVHRSPEKCQGRL